MRTDQASSSGSTLRSEILEGVLEGFDMPYTASSTAPLHVLINPFAWLLWAIDFLLWVLLNPLPGLGPLKMLLSLVRGQVSREEKTGQRLNVLTQGEPINQLLRDLSTRHDAIDERSVLG